MVSCPAFHSQAFDRMVHIALHFLVPALVVGVFFRDRWRAAYLAMIATMLVDIDHALADPIYDPGRCSIGFHPLHEPWLFVVYGAMCFVPGTRFLGIGLLIHMGLDAVDCQVTSGVWGI